MEISEEKIKALHDLIVEECRRQSFTIEEFNRLVLDLGTTLHFRQQEISKELF